MKKCLSFILIVALVTGTMLVASAANDTVLTDITKDQAVSSVLKCLRSGWNVNLNAKQYQPTIKLVANSAQLVNNEIDVRWNYTENDTKTIVHATVDGVTGFVNKIFYENYFVNSEDKNKIFTAMSDSEAQKIAEDFVKKVFPTKFKDLELVSSKVSAGYNAINYEYVFYRKLNGAYVNNNYISVSVSSDNKQVAGYTSKWYENIKFENKKGIINKYQALKNVKESIPINLRYFPIIRINDYTTKTYLPIYSTTSLNGYALNAKTGEIIDHEWKKAQQTEVFDITAEKRAEITKVKSQLKQNEQPISKERATEVVTDYIEGIYGQGYQVTELTLIDNSDDNFANVMYEWNASFKKENAKGKLHINALTERLLLASVNNIELNPEDIKSTSQEAYNKAIEVIKEYYPDKINDIETKIELVEHKNNQFVFTRKVNGVLYHYNGVAILFDKNNTNIRYIDMTWDKNPPEYSDTLINESVAVKNYFENYKPELYYVLYNTTPESEQKSFEMRLVYNLPNSYYDNFMVDATNGQLLTRNLTKIDSNHSTNFIKDQYITKYDAVKSLLGFKEYYVGKLNNSENIELKFTDIGENSSYYAMLQNACQLGMVDNTETAFNGQSFITRTELAKMMIKLLGYDRFAELQNIYKLSFADSGKINKDDYGYIALAVGFGLLQPENNNLNTEDYVNKLDLLIASYNLENQFKK
ncbi:hypothetical protein IMX26_16415 [Clostridium sp. 'deep sea']|uniref:YcdB/YcdC domain-containing protein n=1 Tax=Clostridium sp. 'deep sea' TaxID=2779445 RepID=UPI00189672C9|nr:YcdB/YcdC domain-containing protein [Clostridium sp. 'deep sea']QOR35023.1 hypothetical protein IMX26_16415 [Clostridium sp. 'deep sea']